MPKNANLPPTRNYKKADEEFILSEDDAREEDDRKPTRGQYYLLNQQFDRLPQEDCWSKGGCLALPVRPVSGRGVRRGVRAGCPPGCIGPSGVRAGYPPGCPVACGLSLLCVLAYWGTRRISSPQNPKRFPRSCFEDNKHKHKVRDVYLQAKREKTPGYRKTLNIINNRAVSKEAG